MQVRFNPICNFPRKLAQVSGRSNFAVPPHLNGDGFGIGWYCDPDESESTYDFIQQVPSVGRDSRAVSTREGTEADGDQELSTQLMRSETPGVYTSITPAWNNPNLVRYETSTLCPLKVLRLKRIGVFGLGQTFGEDPVSFGIRPCTRRQLRQSSVRVKLPSLR